MPGTENALRKLTGRRAAHAGDCSEYDTGSDLHGVQDFLVKFYTLHYRSMSPLPPKDKPIHNQKLALARNSVCAVQRKKSSTAP